MNHKYDYIIAGAGASGLSLAWHIVQSPLAEKQILIVDSKLEPQNNKTWCFWDSGDPPFPDLIYKKWNRVELGLSRGYVTQQLAEFSYYCIRSIDFSKKILGVLRTKPNITFLEDEITELTSDSGVATLHTKKDSFDAEYIFQSCFEPEEVKQNAPHYPLLQHFRGWEIVTNKPVFDNTVFTLMDFDNTFEQGIAFMYLLPWSRKSMLLEYTIFSDCLLRNEVYAEKIALYLNQRFNLQPIDYKIQRREFGVIPMQDRPDPLWYGPRILNIGIQGGLTKPSTGYTFRRIQEHTSSILQSLLNDSLPDIISPFQTRYKAYDLWLLHIIHEDPGKALEIFNQLLSNNTMDEVFRFLGEEGSLADDLKIMSSVSYPPFLRAIWKTSERLMEI